jgi:hypothetical protein
MTDKNKAATTREDSHDLGVPMTPGEGPEGPEDALDPNARGDYTDRLGWGSSYEIRVVGHREDGSPIIEKVRQK